MSGRGSPGEGGRDVSEKSAGEKRIWGGLLGGGERERLERGSES